MPFYISLNSELNSVSGTSVSSIRHSVCIWFGVPVIHGATRFTRTFAGFVMAAMARMIPSTFARQVSNVLS